MVLESFLIKSGIIHQKSNAYIGIIKYLMKYFVVRNQILLIWETIKGYKIYYYVNNKKKSIDIMGM